MNKDGTFVDHEGDSGKYEVKVRETDYSDDYVYFSYSTEQKMNGRVFRNDDESIWGMSLDVGTNLYFDNKSVRRMMTMKKNRIISFMLVLTLMFTMLITPSTVSAASKIHISKAKITLSYTTCIYDGKAKKPAVTVKYKNKTLRKGKDYTVGYSNNVHVGGAEVIIAGMGKYSGASSKRFTIIPKNTPGIFKVCAQIEIDGRQLLVRWNPQTKETTGYQVQVYNTKSKRTTGYAIEPNTEDNTIIKAQKKTKYKVRLRTYKLVDGKYYFSAWKKWVQVKTW
ncbi:MAG: hypothetical protein Q4C80_07565 [Bacillota bacterium]|nr:hypothetical protein [Bacillota bacterium]